jgi:hypothetical protein
MLNTVVGISVANVTSASATPTLELGALIFEVAFMLYEEYFA